MDIQSRETAAVPELHRSRYGYRPTEWITILYIVLFSTSTLIYVIQAFWYKLYFFLVTAVICGFLEILGWAARLWSSINDTALNPYIMQITTTIIGPTPLIAANFVMLGQLIKRLGPCYSRLSAKWYTIVFVSFDIVALVIQAVGGAKAATAVQNNENPNTGGHIMLAGIVFQFVAITFYMGFAVEFLLRVIYDKPVRSRDVGTKQADLDKNNKLMLLALAASSLFIYIRSIYRTIELSNGWQGSVIHTQWLFNVFDGAMITLAMYTINILNPGRLIGPGPTWTEAGWNKAKQRDSEDDTLAEATQITTVPMARLDLEKQT